MHKAAADDGDNELISTLLLLPTRAFESLVSYPVRLSIMNSLINGPLTVTDIASRLKLAKGVVHRHLKILEKMGWVTVASDEIMRILDLSREANRVYYMLSSLIYFGYDVNFDGCEIQLKVNGKYVAFADSRKGVLIVKTPTATYGCVKSCGNG
ncbi:MAG: winged helix-turn-helix domain-containing protein, partial [Caldivirga sp.]|nr:winged helix-turn-helix domain-containing protein [Caldivirga sp.]